MEETTQTTPVSASAEPAPTPTEPDARTSSMEGLDPKIELAVLALLQVSTRPALQVVAKTLASMDPNLLVEALQEHLSKAEYELQQELAKRGIGIVSWARSLREERLCGPGAKKEKKTSTRRR